MQEKVDLKDLFVSDKDFQKELASVNKKINKYKKYEGHLYDSPEKLYEFLEYDNNISKRIERLYLYAHINNDLDLTNKIYQEYLGEVTNLFNRINEITSYALPELLTNDYKVFAGMVKKYPKLKSYQFNMKKIFRSKKLIKSKEEEQLISLLKTSYSRPEMISELLINTDLDYGYIIDENQKQVKLTNSNFSTYLESNDPRVRKDAFDTFYKEIKAHENTFASILGTEIINNNRVAKLRNFKSAKALSLYQDEIKLEIFDNLIKSVTNNLPNFYKYYELKKDVLKLKELHIYDTYAPLTKEYNKKYSYDEAKKIILEALSSLGETYINDLKKAFDENWIDVNPQANKRDGGYCTCAYLTHPYIVVNFEKRLTDVSTLAHELGHAMHYYYAQKNNEYQDYNYSIFVAEVASQVNEIILTKYLLDNALDKEEKKYLLDQILQRFKATIIRQTMFAEFEDLIHTKEANGTILTKNFLEEEYYKLNKKYYGKDTIIDDNIKYECFRIPHFYYNFYVYQYATGYASAMKIANDIINRKDGALEKYLKFLSLGSTKDPINSLKVAGVDISDSEIYNDIFKTFNKYLKELRDLYE